MADDDSIILHFGKFRGKDLEDVPSDYLEWLLRQEWLEEKYSKYVEPIEMELKFRSVWNTHFYGDAKE
jgi:uncharacterized protein (DUF3820 family)